MKSTFGYTNFQMMQRVAAQERNSMKADAKGASKGATGNMKTVKRVAAVKINSTK